MFYQTYQLYMGGRKVTRGRREKGRARPGRWSPVPRTSKLPARGSRPETETNGFAGSRARTVPAAGPPPPNFPARGSRPETENKGLAGSQARTGSPVGPTFSKLSARGSRLKTEIKGFARSQARTMPGPPRQASLHQWTSRLSCSPFGGTGPRLFGPHRNKLIVLYHNLYSIISINNTKNILKSHIEQSIIQIFG